MIDSRIIQHSGARWGGVRVDRWHLSPGEMPETVTPAHEINIPVAGSFTSLKHTAAGGSRWGHSRVGRVYLSPAGQPVSASWREELECLTIMIDPRTLALAASESGAGGEVELRDICDVEDPLIEQIGFSLLAEAAAQEPFGRLYAETMTHALAVHLLRRYGVSGRRRETFRGGLAGSKLRRATEFIDEHLESDLSLADIAASAGLSRYHFARAFKRATGLTPQRYLIERRIERAGRLLAESELPLVEVAARAGFKNQSHFTTLFRRLKRVTPGAWREAHSRK